MKDKVKVPWIGERCSRARKTLIVYATSKKDAQMRLDRGEGEGVDVSYYDIGRAKVVRRDGNGKKSMTPWEIMGRDK